MKKIYILVGDPNDDMENKSLNTMLADEYMRGAKESGHEVRYTHLGSIKFDPILHKGYRVIQPLEPDLVQVQEDMKWADHIVIFHPVWWDSMPSLLKGMFDRMWIPGFAFNYRKTGLLKGMAWIKDLKGKSARIVQTSGSWPIIVTLIFGDPSKLMRVGILGFAGVSPIKVTKFGPATKAPEARIHKWKKKVYMLGMKGK
jgi:putative NADPH-quinone reductase